MHPETTRIFVYWGPTRWLRRMRASVIRLTAARIGAPRRPAACRPPMAPRANPCAASVDQRAQGLEVPLAHLMVLPQKLDPTLENRADARVLPGLDEGAH